MCEKEAPAVVGRGGRRDGVYLITEILRPSRFLGEGYGGEFGAEAPEGVLYS